MGWERKGRAGGWMDGWTDGRMDLTGVGDSDSYK